MNIGVILILVYILGMPIYMFIDRKCIPYKEGDYTIEFDGAHEITPEIHKINCVGRTVFWPLMIAIIVLLMPMKLLDMLFDKLNIYIKEDDYYEDE